MDNYHHEQDCCGHGHHHEYSHEQGCCGHHHEHSHEPEHCGHGHPHNHSHHEDEKEIYGVHISHHEGASIFSLRQELAFPYEETLACIQLKLEELSAWVEAQGGLVGHIKGLLTDEPRSAMLSTTGASCHIIKASEPVVRFELACIVFSTDEEAMCRKLRQLFTPGE